MTPAVIAALATIAAAIIAAFVAWVVALIKDKRDYQAMILAANDKLIDQLQEERGEIKADVAQLKSHVGGLLLQGRHKDDYINKLRVHIEDGKPPPPPGYPPELLRIPL